MNRYLAGAGVVVGMLWAAESVAKPGPEVYVQERYVLYTFQVENTGNEPVARAEFWCQAPVRQTPLQKTLRVKTVPEADRQADEWGNQTLHFTLTNLPPYGLKIFRVEVDLAYAETPQPMADRDLDVFLQAEPFVESDAPEIRAVADGFPAGAANAVARQIYDWIVANVKYSGYQSEELGALWALNNRRGDCTEQADLFVALCRARGIPARRMSGYLCDRNRRLVPALFHDWAEYYDGNRWQRVDVQRQAFETAVADHVAMRVHAGGAPADSCRFRVEGKGVKATMKDAE